MALPFIATSQRGDTWFSVGLASSFANVTDPSGVVLSDQALCFSTNNITGCKVFLAPDAKTSSGNKEATQLSSDPDEQLNASLGKGDQVLVFQYKGTFHAVDNKCPHSSFPLSAGTPFDVEDFGVALSAGITCPKHGWSFDLFSGRADRGAYRLKVWEVQVRDVVAGSGVDGEREVWVRRRQRMG